VLGKNYIKAGQIRLANLTSGQMTSIDSSIINTSIEYSMTMASQLQFTVIDFNNEMMNRNYFLVGRDVIYTTQTACLINGESTSNVSSAPKYTNLLFEIAQVNVSQGPGNTPQIEVSCYSKAIQQMKRDRKPGEIKGSGSEYVKRAAQKYGLRCFVEKTSQRATINKASGDEQAESLWDVLSGIASEAKFVLFEADGILFFASQKYLMNKWGSFSYTVDRKGKRGTPSKKVTEYSIPIVNWKSSWEVNQGVVYGTSATAPAIELMEYPTFTVSANDPLDTTGSFSIARENGTKFRPGMTIEFIGFPGDLDDYYLIDSVSFEDNTPDPVQVSFRQPEKKPKDIKDIAVGKRFKQRNIADTSRSNRFLVLEEIGSKNSKQNRPNTQADLNRKTMGLVSADELTPGQIGDPRVFPLPTILNQQVYPRYDSPGQVKLLATGNMDMYSRPTTYVDGKLTTTALMIVENVTQPGFNSGNPYVAIIPRVYVSGGQPEVYSEASASSAFISAMSTNSPADFIAKMADLESASDYVKLINHQQVLVLSSRFRTESIPETCIYPLPTDEAEQNYPYMDGLYEVGNINLYSLPAGKIDGKPTTFIPYFCLISIAGDSLGKIYSAIWAIGGSAKKLTEKEAFKKSNTEDLQFGISPVNKAEIYATLLMEQQQILLNERFSGNYSSLGDL
jgi:hypothetical protein